MDEARHVPTDTTYTAVAFAKLSPATIAVYRQDLACTECGRHAYYVSKSINGKPPFFGARPHAPNCELATTAAEKDAESLPIANSREAREGVLKLQGQRDQDGGKHVEDDPQGKPHLGRGRKYVISQEKRGLATPTIAMNQLLRHLVRDPDYREGRETKIVFPDNTEATVAGFCVEMHDVNGAAHGNRRRLFWGTVIYAEEKTWTQVSRDGSGTTKEMTSVWLRTAWGLPNVRLDSDIYEIVAQRKRINDIGDLAGASFLYYGYMNVAENGLLYMVPKDPLWFVVRLASQDEGR